MLFIIFIISIFLKLYVNSNVYINKEPNIVVNKIAFRRPSGLTELCQVNNDFLIRTNSILLRMNPDVLECLTGVDFKGTIASKSLSSSNVKQWIIFSTDRFGFKDEQTWIPSVISTCGNSHDSFLGGQCKLGHGSVKRVYSNIPYHTQIRVTGRVHYFDQWTGQSIILKANNNVLWNESHDWCPSVTDDVCRKYGIDVCGQEYPDRLSVNFDVSMLHDGNDLILEFTSTLDESINSCDASWGIDDIALYIR